MQQKHLGWVVGVGALGMMLGLIGNEVGELQRWGDALAPSFVGKTFLHASTVIAAFVGGRLIPTAAETHAHHHEHAAQG